jgi:RNA polymerase sigma factor (sigma-70 family)
VAASGTVEAGLDGHGNKEEPVTEDQPAPNAVVDSAEATFSEFVEAFAPSRLWPVARRYVAFWGLPPDRAGDILQETLSRTWPRWGTRLVLEDTERQLAFVFTTMHNVVREEARRSRVHDRHDDLAVENAEREASSEDVERRVLGRTALRAVQKGLARLSDEERRILELSLAGLSSPVIGEQLGLTATNVRNKLKRARDGLREVIGPDILEYLGMGAGSSTTAGGVA